MIDGSLDALQHTVRILRAKLAHYEERALCGDCRDKVPAGTCPRCHGQASHRRPSPWIACAEPFPALNQDAFAAAFDAYERWPLDAGAGHAQRLRAALAMYLAYTAAERARAERKPLPPPPAPSEGER